VEEARTRPIIEVARSLGLEPKRAGKEWVVSCPLHEDKTPSMYLNPEKGLWTCFSCGQGGDGIQLVMEARKMGFTDAVREMAA
jgi:DNA primase